MSDRWVTCSLEAHALPQTGATAANGHVRTFWTGCAISVRVSERWVTCSLEAHALPRTGATAADGHVRTFWTVYANPVRA